ncbi:hypothetical protein EXIGLDRAFT_838862 [Exidia glandulosa HHB12029]|uniref:F-box domain-containing protein n=1 Tax=Exidia glandulosa HHB12029 TaxID=1314781 RepID=A0A165FG65_EXIGL|nr:hypothetical protein EXIGLDRAFT_838862 [Exidia glandulosa HHB12029]
MTESSASIAAVARCCSRPSLWNSLPVDVLYLIRDALHEWDGPSQAKAKLSVPRVEDFLPPESFTSRQHPLCALSSTCRTLRSICLPSLFRHVFINGDVETPFPPSQIWQYIHRLHYYRSWMGWDDRPEHARCLFAMPALREVHYYGKGTHDVVTDNLDLSLAAPALDALYLKNIHLTNEGVSTIRPVVPLRIFCMYFLYRFRDLATISGAELEDENQRIEAVTDDSRLSMEEMVLPGEATRSSFLSRSPWPNLRILVLCGGSPTLDVPFAGILLAMPGLESLTLSVAPREGTAPVVVCPPGTVLPLDLRNLRHFAVAFPTDTDEIFTHLSSALRTLALRDMPRYYVRKLWLLRNETSQLRAYAAPILSYRSLARIFEALDGEHLERLEVVVREDDTEAETLARVAFRCPNLRFFELHRYRSDPNEWQGLSVVPVGHIAQCLSSFHSLETLRVQLDFPLGHAAFNPDRNLAGWDEWDCFIHDQAQTIVDSLPWLRNIAILCADRSGSTSWRTWTVQREEGSGATPKLGDSDITHVEEVWM